MTDRGAYMRLQSGVKFYPLDPRPEEIVLFDVIHNLSNKCRYGGACKKFYSVAEHSVRVWAAMLCDGHSVELATLGLLHDVGEAYVPDVPRPLKAPLAWFKELETRIANIALEKFGVLNTPQAHEVVKYYDDAILYDEMSQLMPAGEELKLYAPGLGVKITPWSPKGAAKSFGEALELCGIA